MVRLRTWRRVLAMALSVLVMVAVVGGPSLESLLCGGEGGLAAAAAEPMHAALDATDHAAANGDFGAVDEGLAPCIHGDCHHVAPAMPTPPSMTSAPLAIAGDAQRPERRRVATGDLQFGLMRPPRG